MDDKKTALKSIILRVLFIVAIVIVIIILAFAIIRFIPMAFSSFASVSNLITSPFDENEIVVTTNDSNLTDNDNFLLSWEHKPENSGVYKLTYKCIDKLRLNAVLTTGEQTILCNTQYTLPEDGKIELEANFGQEDAFVDLPIEISFVDDVSKNIEARGETLITIQNDENPTPVGNIAGATVTSQPVENDDDSNTNNNNPTNNSSQTVNNVVIPADLAIINADPIDDLTVQFVIKNIGGQSTGNWTLSYTVPGEGTETVSEPSFRPGDAKKYTLRFDSGTPDGTTVITADSTNKVSEASENNNKASIKIDGDDSSSSSGNNDFDSDDDADFVIKDLEVGRMSGSKFVADDEIDEDDDAAIRFVVVNRGGEETEDWRFEVKNLPYDDEDDFRSKEYDALNPGESLEVTVEFENPEEGNYSIRVEIDSEDDTDEESESNNDDSETLDVEN